MWCPQPLLILFGLQWLRLSHRIFGMALSLLGSSRDGHKEKGHWLLWDFAFFRGKATRVLLFRE